MKKNILDVGCGDKPMGDVNVDLNWYYYDLGRSLMNIMAEAMSLPFKNNSFDLVCSRHLIEHLENPYGFVQELARVSKKFIYITCPNARNWRWWLFEKMSDGHTYQGFSLEVIKKMFAYVDYKVMAYDYHNKDSRKLDTLLNLVPFLNKREIRVLGVKKKHYTMAGNTIANDF